MKKYILLLITISAAFVFMQCSGESNAETETITTKSYAVQVLNLEPRDFNEFIEVTGTLKAKKRINIIVEEGGILKKIHRDKGTYVRRGDTLAVLENEVLRAAYEEARALMRQSELDFNSKKVLFQKKAIPENEFLISQYGLERAKASYKLAKARYEKLFILAKISGFVNERYYDQGAYTTPMTPLYELVDNSAMKIKAGVAERFKNEIDRGTPVVITLDAFPDIKIEENISFISQTINSQSRTFNIEIEINNPQRKFAPEMIANLRILKRSFSDRIVVPLDALIESEFGKFVFIDEDNTAKRVQVDILAVHEDSVLVDGLDTNQKLIITGHRELTEGDALEIIQ